MEFNSTETYANRYDLDEIDVFLEGNFSNPMFFNINGLPNQLSFGKHYFNLSILDSTNQEYELRPNSKILFEFKSKNNVILRSDVVKLNQKNGVATCLNNTAGIYKIQGQLIEALDNYKSSLKIYEEIGYKSGIALALNSMGNILNKQGDLKKTLIYGLKSLTISQEIGSPKRIREASILLSRVYGKLGKGMKALEMYKLHITMKDSLNNEATQKASIQRQSKYEYEKQKVIDDAVSDKKVALEKEKQKKQFIVLVIIIIASCLVLVLLLIIYRLKIKSSSTPSQKEEKPVIATAHPP